MYRLFLLILVACLTNCNSANIKSSTENIEPIKSTETTTFFFVRHAEKEKDQKDPALTEEGRERANQLAKILQDVPLDAIYSSDYNRTKQTAEPIAKQKGISVQLYDPSDLEGTGKSILEKHERGKILVVGHSNSTPNFINLIAGSEKASSIDESEYSNLYILNLHTWGDAEVLQLRY